MGQAREFFSPPTHTRFWLPTPSTNTHTNAIINADTNADTHATHSHRLHNADNHNRLKYKDR